MKSGRVWIIALTTAFALAPLASAQEAPKPAPLARYTAVAGDNVPTIVRKVKYPDVTESQMYYAFVRANLNNFSFDTVDRVLPGMRLVIPAHATVAKVDVKTADDYMANLRKAETIYAQGVALEDKDDMKGAIEKYIAAAKIGHAYAQQKLGQLYDRDNTRTLPRDFQESMRYYYEARKRGREIKGPARRTPLL